MKKIILILFMLFIRMGHVFASNFGDDMIIEYPEEQAYLLITIMFVVVFLIFKFLQLFLDNINKKIVPVLSAFCLVSLILLSFDVLGIKFPSDFLMYIVKHFSRVVAIFAPVTLMILFILHQLYKVIFHIGGIELEKGTWVSKHKGKLFFV
jgi:hypothetical protein